MVKIPLIPELFPNTPILWMDDVGPVVLIGEFVFCCECESEQEISDIYVRVYEKPDILSDDLNESIPQTRVLGKRNFRDEGSLLHIRNFIMKFAKDEQYRKDFLVAP